jgi:cysteine synthase
MHYVNVAKRIANETPNSFRINQYDNPLNPEAHYLTTGPEIWEQTGGRVTHFIAAGSTGGTISRISKYLK